MTTQQEFLREAMRELDMTRDVFSCRLGCSRRALDKWLLPDESNDNRRLDETIWVLVREVLAHEKLKREHEKLKQKVSATPCNIPIGDI